MSGLHALFSSTIDTHLTPSQIIIEVFLGQGKIIEALRLANSLSGAETLSARKYLEAAKKTNDPIVFYTVYTWFQQRNIRHRGSPDFLKSITKFFRCIHCFSFD